MVSLTKTEKRCIEICDYLIQDNEWELFYAALGIEADFPNSDYRGRISQFLYEDCGIDFLKYMSYIPGDCFYGSNIESIDIPNSIKLIGEHAFMYCTQLKTVTLSDTITHISKGAFMHCRALESIIIPDSVTCIEDRAFAFCASLKYITIPKSVKLLDDNYIFSQCPDLTIRCKRGSHASRYAKRNNIKVEYI